MPLPLRPSAAWRAAQFPGEVGSLGDGAVMYGSSGFWTMARYSLPILTIVWNNLNYQTVRTNFAAWGGEMVKQNKYPEVYL
ncbi:MAG: hypothetical protein HC778_03555, partial [Chamaesiphon sp. CSU_1_12]|nr:hypothetical protein [Chamaesiphon sp. CSU_1_12]